MYIVLTFILLLVTLHFYKKSKWKYKNLPSPGLSLPIIGHSYKMMNKNVLKDLTNGIWEIYRKYQRDGLLYINTLSLNCLWIGDFDTLKHVFNLPEVQKRLNDNIIKLALNNRSGHGEGERLKFDNKLSVMTGKLVDRRCPGFSSVMARFGLNKGEWP